jgi:hypothetical protein
MLYNFTNSYKLCIENLLTIYKQVGQTAVWYQGGKYPHDQGRSQNEAL